MIFLSHSWQNKPQARKVVEALAIERIPCWLDEQQLDYGMPLRASIKTAISQSDIYLYLVSDAANSSDWIRDELEFALDLEHENALRIVPVRLPDTDSPLPPLLRGRVYATLDPAEGGAARLAHDLTSISGHEKIPDNCRLSVTARLTEYGLVHTLEQARYLAARTRVEVHVLLLNDAYNALDRLYWNVVEARFPLDSAPRKDWTSIEEIVSSIHSQSRSIIREAPLVCRRFFANTTGQLDQEYYDKGHQRILHMLLHRLQWNTEYLRHVRGDIPFDEKSVNTRSLPEEFFGHRCEFMIANEKLGTIKVPRHGHPGPSSQEKPIPWGLSSPFSDMLPSEIGIAVGDLLARRFLAQTLPSTEMPAPGLLKYGLA